MSASDPKILYGVKCLPVEDAICQISVWIHRTVPAVFLAIGTFGNIINIIVLSRKNVRNTPCFLLVFLAVFDILCLLSLFLHTPFRLGYGIEIRSLSFLACSIQTWLSTFSGAASLWTVAIFTIERMLFAMFPHRTSIHLTRNKSIVVTGLIVLSLGSILGALTIGDSPDMDNQNGNHTNTSISQNGFECWRISIEGKSMDHLLQTVTLLLCNMIPFFIVIVGNIILLVHLCRRSRQGSAAESQTILLLLITGVMLATLAAFGVFVFTFQVLSDSLDKSYPVSELLFAMVYSLIMANHALNFVLYVWKGTLFKKECGLIWQELKSLRCVCRSA